MSVKVKELVESRYHLEVPKTGERCGLPLPRNLVGVEIEVENLDHPDRVSKHIMPLLRNGWIHKNEGSLGQDAGGMELILNPPRAGDALIQSIREVCQGLIAAKAEANLRTGIHVHINVQDLTLEQVKSLCMAYALLEDLLYTWVGDNRRSNNYCLPWYTAVGDITRYARIFSYDQRKDSWRYLTAEPGRYAGLNLQALGKFGSVEFRHLQTTFDAERILIFIRFAQYLKRAGREYEPTQHLNMLSAMGARKYAKQILGKVFEDFWYQDGEEIIWTDCLLAAQDFLYEQQLEVLHPINIDKVFSIPPDKVQAVGRHLLTTWRSNYPEIPRAYRRSATSRPERDRDLMERNDREFQQRLQEIQLMVGARARPLVPPRGVLNEPQN